MAVFLFHFYRKVNAFQGWVKFSGALCRPFCWRS